MNRATIFITSFISVLLLFLLTTSCDKKNNKEAPDPKPSYVTFTMIDNLTDQYKTLYLFIDALPEDRENIWIDKNGNGQMDAGEKITKFGLNYDHQNEIKFTAKKELKLYGKVTHLMGRTNFRFSQFSSGTNKTMKYLDFGVNFMEAIDISGFANLEHLGLRTNDIKSLDLSKCSKLKVLDLGYTNYFSSSFSNCRDLEYLDLSGRYFARFSLSGFSKLKVLKLKDNALREFDASKLSALEGLDLRDNKLTSTALDQLFSTLPDRKGQAPGILLIAGNPGVNTANRTLAEANNWQVDDTAERLDTDLDRDHLPILKW